MTAKEKADELLNRFKSFKWATYPRARRCASICVAAMLEELDKIAGYDLESEDDSGKMCGFNERKDFLNEVRNELSKL